LKSIVIIKSDQSDHLLLTNTKQNHDILTVQVIPTEFATEIAALLDTQAIKEQKGLLVNL